MAQVGFLEKVVRKVGRMVLERFDYEVVKTNKLNELMEKEFPLGAEFKFVQVGAYDGVSFDGIYHFVINRNTKGVVVEPIPANFEKLKKNYSPFPEIVPVNMAVHQSEKEVEMFVLDEDKKHLYPDWVDGMSSVVEGHHVNRVKGFTKDALKKVIVPCIDLMDLMKRENLLDADLIQVDAEGYDEQVVRMIDFEVVKPKYIKYEIEHIGEESLKSLEALLSKNGYQTIRHDTDGIAFLS